MTPSVMAGQDDISLSEALRWDGLFWRRLAYFGSVWGPSWWKKGSPPVFAALFFALIGPNRRAVVENLRQVLGRRGWCEEHRAALQTFIEFAYVFQETLEFEGHRLHGAELADALELELDIQYPAEFDLDEVLAQSRGMIVLTSHFGCWEIGARVMQKLDRPVNLVMATEANETVEHFAVRKKEQHGLNVIHSDRSLFSSVEMIRALRRGEIVAIQLDRAAPGQVTQPIDFFGRPAAFQIGPFMLAKLAEVPIWPVYVVRMGRRKFRFLPEPLRYVDRRADRDEVLRVMRDVIGSFEENVRTYPNQWFQFHRVWDSGT